MNRLSLKWLTKVNFITCTETLKDYTDTFVEKFKRAEANSDCMANLQDHLEIRALHSMSATVGQLTGLGIVKLLQNLGLVQRAQAVQDRRLDNLEKSLAKIAEVCIFHE